MLTIVWGSQFKRDFKLVSKRHTKNKNHKLKGNYADYWECHIEPDWLLIYQLTSEELILIRTGSHADLF